MVCCVPSTFRMKCWRADSCRVFARAVSSLLQASLSPPSRFCVSKTPSFETDAFDTPPAPIPRNVDVHQMVRHHTEAERESAAEQSNVPQDISHSHFRSEMHGALRTHCHTSHTSPVRTACDQGAAPSIAASLQSWKLCLRGRSSSVACGCHSP